MKFNTGQTLLFILILIAAYISINMQLVEILGHRHEVTAVEDLRLETLSWRIIALLSVFISTAQYFLFRFMNNLISWIGLLVSILAITFPITLGVARVFQSFINA